MLTAAMRKTILNQEDSGSWGMRVQSGYERSGPPRVCGLGIQRHRGLGAGDPARVRNTPEDPERKPSFHPRKRGSSCLSTLWPASTRLRFFLCENDITMCIVLRPEALLVFHAEINSSAVGRAPRPSRPPASPGRARGALSLSFLL